MLDFIKTLGDRVNRKDLYAESCLFIREGKNTWEEGILIDSGIGGLLDINGQEVGNIEDVKITKDFLIDTFNREEKNNIVSVYVDDIEGWQTAELLEKYKSGSTLEKWRMKTKNGTEIVRYVKDSSYNRTTDGCGYFQA